jgi:hypothetical protein
VTSSTLTTTFVRLLITSTPLVVLLAMAATAADGQAAGKGTAVKAQAEANARRLSAGSAAQETIRTGDSKLSAGPRSSVRPDKNVNDPNKSAGAVAIESGSYRFVTGSQGKRSYRLKTPYGSLDVRG